MLTQSPVDPQLQRELMNRLTHAAQERGLEDSKLRLFFSGSKVKDDWLFLPVDLTISDAWDKATHLQALEDAWNDRPEDPFKLHLMIVPVGVPLDLD